MAFSANTFLPLSAMANSNAPRHFTYRTFDSNATVAAPGYFDEAVASLGLRQADVVWSIDANGGSEAFSLVYINAIAGDGVVTVLSANLLLT